MVVGGGGGGLGTDHDEAVQASKRLHTDVTHCKGLMGEQSKHATRLRQILVHVVDGEVAQLLQAQQSQSGSRRGWPCADLVMGNGYKVAEKQHFLFGVVVPA